MCETVFKLPLIYFIFISDKGQVTWILILQGDLYVRYRTPRRALRYGYRNELTCFACKSRGGLLCPALLGALVEIKGVQAAFMPLYFPFLLFSIPLFPYCVFILLPSSKGAEKLLLVLLLFLSSAFEKSVFWGGEGIRQMKTISALQNLRSSCGTEL